MYGFVPLCLRVDLQLVPKINQSIQNYLKTIISIYFDPKRCPEIQKKYFKDILKKSFKERIQICSFFKLDLFMSAQLFFEISKMTF